MAKITIKVNQDHIRDIRRKGDYLERELRSPEGFVYSYMLTVANEYQEAVLSGIGHTTTGVLTLKDFLGQAVAVNWKPNALATSKLKHKNFWSLAIWKASGEVEQAVKIYKTNSSGIEDIFVGIDGGVTPGAYDKAIRTEFGGVPSNPGGKNIEGRALFTLLNVVFAAHTEQITAQIMAAIRASIVKAGWGR